MPLPQITCRNMSVILKDKKILSDSILVQDVPFIWQGSKMQVHTETTGQDHVSLVLSQEAHFFTASVIWKKTLSITMTAKAISPSVFCFVNKPHRSKVLFVCFQMHLQLLDAVAQQGHCKKEKNVTCSSELSSPAWRLKAQKSKRTGPHAKLLPSCTVHGGSSSTWLLHSCSPKGGPDTVQLYMVQWYMVLHKQCEIGWCTILLGSTPVQGCIAQPVPWNYAQQPTDTKILSSTSFDGQQGSTNKP